jgi:hypothetical protein
LLHLVLNQSSCWLVKRFIAWVSESKSTHGSKITVGLPTIFPLLKAEQLVS